MASIILASQSKARKTMLDGAGLAYEACPADINEADLTAELVKKSASAGDIALALAKSKALTISDQRPDALVIGSDQVLTCEGKLFAKAKNADQAYQKLKQLSGKTHTLISAAAVCQAGQCLWTCSDEAHLSMHPWDESFMKSYVTKAGDALTKSVGAYEIEGLGAWLFSEIRGDTSTILGMPLLQLLTYLRTVHKITP